MPANDPADIQPRPVRKTACYNCGKVVEVAGAKAFDLITCPKCGARIAVPGRLGRDFILLKPLGRGEMGATYKAFEKSLGRHVAIKVMRRSLGADKRRKEDFLTEAKALAALDHPNTVRVHSVGEEDGQPYMVMELINGPRLDQLFGADRPLDEAEALRIGLELAGALGAAGQVGLIHGDVKPANVMLDEKGRAKLLDFGIARFGGGRAGKDDALGTPYYVAPEQVRRGTVDFRADIYSLGATLFQALTGSPPFPGRSMKEVLEARLDRPAPSVRQLRPELNDKTAQVIARMLAPSPEDRYGDYRELTADLRAALAAVTGSAAPHEELAAAPAGARKRRARAGRFPRAVAVAVVLAAAGAAAWYAFFRHEGADWVRRRMGAATLPTQPASAPLQRVAEPVLSPGGGVIPNLTEVTISCRTAGADVRYTTDGSEPTTNSPVYAGPVPVRPGTTLLVRAYRDGWNPSDLVKAVYAEDPATRAETVGVRAAAQKAWERVRGLPRGQGFGERLDRCEVLLAKAEDLFNHGAYADAGKPYSELASLCEQVEGLQRQRQAAAEARQGADGLLTALAGAASRDDPNLVKAQGAAKAAEAAFETGKFPEARRQWGLAEQAARDVENALLKDVRSAWESAVKDSELAILQTHGGAAWLAIDESLQQARQAEAVRAYAEARRHYAEAARRLPDARRVAAAALLRQGVAERLAKVRQLQDAGEWRKAMSEVDELLKLQPDNRDAQKLRLEVNASLHPVVDLGDGGRLDFTLIDPGKFVMGAKGEKDAAPHEVTLTRRLYFGTAEVTRLTFRAFAEKGRYATSAERGTRGAYALRNGRWVFVAGANWRNPGWNQDWGEPAVCVSLQDAMEFCRWASERERSSRKIRLPTEAEWEYACRAGSQTGWCFGDASDDLPRYANYGAKESKLVPLKQDKYPLDRFYYTAPVRRYKLNAWGLHDMHGNVMEWCADRYADYRKEPATDPTGPARGAKWVVRGGSWRSSAADCRCAVRFGVTGEYRASDLGFRVVMEVVPPAPTARAR